MLGPNDLIFSSTPVAHFPLMERLDPARRAGFRGLSIQPFDVWKLEAEGVSPAETGKRIRDHGLDIAEVDCIGYWLPQHFQEDVPKFGEELRNLVAKRVIPAAAAVGARSIAVVEMHGIRPSVDEAASALEPICRMAADHGLIIHIEFAPFGGIPDIETAYAIVQATGCDNAALTVDSWHFTRGGSTLEQLAQIPGRRIGTVQINDGPLEGRGDPLEECMTVRRLPGEGEFDLVGLIRTLDQIGSEVGIGIEVFSEKQKHQTLVEIAEDWARSARNILNKAREKN